MKRMFLLGLAVLLLTVPAGAQNLSSETIQLYAHRDLDSATFEYCRLEGLNQVASDRPIPGRVRIDATAASTTVTGTNAFANVGVGDLLLINHNGRTLYRSVIARASADSITVDTQLHADDDVVDAPFNYRKIECGTADTSGAFSVGGAHSFSIQVILGQEDSASTDYQIECRNSGSGMSWVIVDGPNNDTTTFTDIWTTDLPFSECRVGVKVNTDDGTDTGAAAEQFSVVVNRRF